MTNFSDLPHEIVVMILQSVDFVWPPSILSTNRNFYTYLKPTFYGQAIDEMMDKNAKFHRFEEILVDFAELLVSFSRYILPFDEESDYNTETFNKYEALHDLFPHVTACRSLQLAVIAGSRPPTKAQTGSLGCVTELAITGVIPGDWTREGDISISFKQFDAWVKHMPQLTGLYIGPHRDGVNIENLRQLPSTIVRLELLGYDSWDSLSLPDLRSILSGLPSLRHFLLSQMDAPPAEVAAALNECLAPSVTSFGIAFDESIVWLCDGKHDDDKSEGEKELAGFLKGRYTTLTFYLVLHFVDFIEILAASSCSQTVTNLGIKTPTDDWPFYYRTDNALSLQTMYKLLDRSIFPNLAHISASRLKEQMERLEGWAAFTRAATRAGVTLDVDPYGEHGDYS